MCLIFLICKVRLAFITIVIVITKFHNMCKSFNTLVYKNLTKHFVNIIITVIVISSVVLISFLRLAL